MRVWVVEVGEPLPIDPGPPRLMRAGLLCEQLAARGHEAVWFTSAFNHYRKMMRPTGTFDVACEGGAYQVVTLKALGYERHISVRRLRDHHATARDLLANADRFPRPDVICAGLPTLDLADASARLADRYSVPCVVDIQDLWPDIFVERLPRLARPFAAPLLFPMERMARRACGRATGVVGISEPFLQWGLDHARRQPGPSDRLFPLAYQPQDSTAEGTAEAARFWNEQGVDLERPMAAFVGSMASVFEFDHIVDLARRWCDEWPEFLFVLAGMGPERDRLMARAADLPNVVFPGWIDAQQITLLLRSARVGLAPYIPRHDFESTLSNKIIEYLSAGLPIATTLTTGVTATLIRDNQVGASYTSTADSLGDTLHRLVDSPAERQASSARARALFDARFAADLVYGEYADYLAELAVTRRAT